MQFLIIQTAFLGDVILATSVAEKLRQKFPHAKIDFLLKKGNDDLLNNHPFINEVITLHKKENKFINLIATALKIRAKKYDCVVNLHRFGGTGFIVFLSGAMQKIGFEKNPFSFCFTKKYKHEAGNGKHEIERNHELIKEFTDAEPAMPKLYPSENDFKRVSKIVTDHCNQNESAKYICIAPASVWHTKQFPLEKWRELISSLDKNIFIFLMGAKNDFDLCENLKSQTSNLQTNIFNLAGKITLLETAALMKNAKMNYVNDSAPLHIASAMNAPVTAIFCSTVPSFGFTPLSENSIILETKEKLNCRPCGLHGHKQCPQGHFKCAHTINVNITSPN